MGAATVKALLPKNTDDSRNHRLPSNPKKQQPDVVIPVVGNLIEFFALEQGKTLCSKEFEFKPCLPVNLTN